MLFYLCLFLKKTHLDPDQLTQTVVNFLIALGTEEHGHHRYFKAMNAFRNTGHMDERVVNMLYNWLHDLEEVKRMSNVLPPRVVKV